MKTKTKKPNKSTLKLLKKMVKQSAMREFNPSTGKWKTYFLTPVA